MDISARPMDEWTFECQMDISVRLLDQWTFECQIDIFVRIRLIDEWTFLYIQWTCNNYNAKGAAECWP